LDIVVARYLRNSVYVLIQYNRGALKKRTTYASGGGSSLRSIAVADINNDTQLDIIVANYGTDNIGVLFGYGNGTFMSQMMMSMGLKSHPSSIAIGDFNGDTQRDIAVANYGTKNVGMFLGNGKGTLTSQTMIDISFIFAPILLSLLVISIMMESQKLSLHMMEAMMSIFLLHTTQDLF
jgi:hypothetical protein